MKGGVNGSKTEGTLITMAVRNPADSLRSAAASDKAATGRKRVEGELIDFLEFSMRSARR